MPKTRVEVPRNLIEAKLLAERAWLVVQPQWPSWDRMWDVRDDLERTNEKKVTGILGKIKRDLGDLEPEIKRLRARPVSKAHEAGLPGDPETRQLMEELAARLRFRTKSDREAVAAYLEMAELTGNQAGQWSLDALGLDDTWRWSHVRNLDRAPFEVRGSKIIQGVYGTHVDELASIIVRATDPRRPLDLGEVQAEITERWGRLTRKQARVIARTETAAMWETTNWHAMKNNGIERVRWLVGSGPSIGPNNGPCYICLTNAAAGFRSIDKGFPSGDMTPPAHPNCRCAIIGDLKRYLPPKQSWAGDVDLTPTGDQSFVVDSLISFGEELLLPEPAQWVLQYARGYSPTEILVYNIEQEIVRMVGRRLDQHYGWGLYARLEKFKQLLRDQLNQAFRTGVDHLLPNEIQLLREEIDHIFTPLQQSVKAFGTSADPDLAEIVPDQAIGVAWTDKGYPIMHLDADLVEQAARENKRIMVEVLLPEDFPTAFISETGELLLPRNVSFHVARSRWENGVRKLTVVPREPLPDRLPRSLPCAPPFRLRKDGSHISLYKSIPDCPVYPSDEDPDLKRIVSYQEAPSFFDKILKLRGAKNYLDHLSTAEMLTVGEWVAGGSHYPINELLRTGKFQALQVADGIDYLVDNHDVDFTQIPDAWQTYLDKEGTILNRVRLLDGLTQRDVLPESLALFRGLASPTLHEFAKTRGVKALTELASFHDNSFISTTPAIDEALEFVNQQSNDEKVLIAIKTPAGTRGFAVLDEGLLARTEFILPRGQSFRISRAGWLVDEGKGSLDNIELSDDKDDSDSGTLYLELEFGETYADLSHHEIPFFLDQNVGRSDMTDKMVMSMYAQHAEQLNEILRSDVSLTGTFHGSPIQSVLKDYDALTSKRFLTRSVLTYRASVPAELEHLLKGNPRGAIGAIFRDPGYTELNLSRDFVFDTLPSSVGENDPKVLWRVRVPANTTLARGFDAQGDPLDTFVLSRGSRYQVTDTRTEDNLTVVDVQLLVDPDLMRFRKFNEEAQANGFLAANLGYPQLVSHTAYRSFLDEHLSPFQADSFQEYTGTGYRDINAILRGERGSREQDVDPGRWREIWLRINAIDQVIEATPPLQANIAVWRGFTSKELHEDYGFFGEEGFVGESFRDPAFLSTSLRDGVGTNWTGGPESILFEIRVPKGMKAGLAPGAETEVLLPRDTVFTIRSVSKLPTGKLHFVLDVSPGEGRQPFGAYFRKTYPAKLWQESHTDVLNIENSLDDEDLVDHLRTYAGDGATALNEALRRGDEDFEFIGFTNRPAAEFLDDIFDINDVSRQEHDMTLWRGLTLEKTVVNQANYHRLKGAVFTDKAYVSTSLARETAIDFAFEDLDEDHEIPVVIEIRAPAGTRAVPIPGYAGNEAEMLLKRDIHFEIVDVKEVPMREGVGLKGLHLVVDIQPGHRRGYSLNEVGVTRTARVFSDENTEGDESEISDFLLPYEQRWLPRIPEPINNFDPLDVLTAYKTERIYEAIQSAARDPRSMAEEEYSRVKPMIDVIDKALEEAPDLLETIVAYRVGDHRGGPDWEYPGTKWAEKGYTSLTLDYEMAEIVADLRGLDASDIHRVVVPRGTRFAPLDSFIPADRPDSEIILPRGAIFEVLRDPDGRSITQVSSVPGPGLEPKLPEGELPDLHVYDGPIPRDSDYTYWDEEDEDSDFFEDYFPTRDHLREIGVYDDDVEYALKVYASNGYRDINHSLRIEDPNEEAQVLMRMFDHHDVPTTPYVAVWRGTYLERFKGVSDIDLIGATFDDKAFVSTSFNKSDAVDFILDPEIRSHAFDPESSLIFEIRLPNGTSAVLPPSKEFELLLDRGQTFVITDVGYEDIDFVGETLRVRHVVLKPVEEGYKGRQFPLAEDVVPDIEEPEIEDFLMYPKNPQEELFSTGNITNIERFHSDGAGPSWTGRIDTTEIFMKEPNPDMARPGISVETQLTREKAAYVLNQYLDVVDIPPTVLRDVYDKETLVQLFIENSRSMGTGSRGPYVKEELKRIAFFDSLILNGDRHEWNVMLAPGGAFDTPQVIAIDHADAFSADPLYFLRTIDFDDQDRVLQSWMREALQELNGSRAKIERDLLNVGLTPKEVEDIFTRSTIMLEEGKFFESGWRMPPSKDVDPYANVLYNIVPDNLPEPPINPRGAVFSDEPPPEEGYLYFDSSQSEEPEDDPEEYVEAWFYEPEELLNERLITPEQTTTLQHYTVSSAHVNDMLRRGEVPNEARIIDRVFDEFPATISNADAGNHGVVLWRGAYLEEWQAISDEDLIGSIFTDKAFVSTSLDKHTAKLFLDEGGSGPEDLSNVLLEIRSPANTPVIYMGPGEAEFLLKRNSGFVVRSVGRTPDGYRHVVLEPVDPDVFQSGSNLPEPPSEDNWDVDTPESDPWVLPQQDKATGVEPISLTDRGVPEWTDDTLFPSPASTLLFSSLPEADKRLVMMVNQLQANIEKYLEGTPWEGSVFDVTGLVVRSGKAMYDDPIHAIETMKAYNLIAARYPEVAANLSQVGMSRKLFPDRIMGQYNDAFKTMEFAAHGPSSMNRATALEQMRHMIHQTGFHPWGTEHAASVVYHEFGHAADFFMRELLEQQSGDTSLSIDTFWERICERIDEEVYDPSELADTPFVYWMDERSVLSSQTLSDQQTFIERYLSEYGAMSREEFFAEAFAEYMTSSNPRQIARIVGQEFDAWYSYLLEKASEV